MSWGSAMLGALLATLSRPWAWTIALAAFLVRGGIVVVLLPIVVLPTTSGFAIVFAPALTSFIFGRTPPELVALVASGIVAVVAAILFGGVVGAWLDSTVIRDAAEDDELETPAPGGPWLARRAFAARLIAHLPLAVALSWGAMRIVEAAYRQLILPDELATPIVLRVLRDVPDTVTLVVGAWIAGETVGGLAHRRLLAAPVTVVGALRWAVVRVLRHPVSALGTAVVSALVLLGAILPGGLAAAIAWDRLRVVLVAGGSPAEIVVGLSLFVTVWLLALFIAGVAMAWRSLAWTFEAYRFRDAAFGRASDPAAGDGTIGDALGGRPGEWPPAEASGRL